MANRITGYKVLYDLSDVTAVSDASYTVSAQQSFADIDLIDTDISMDKGVTLEHNFFVLDGTKTFLDDIPDDVPFWSAGLSKADGTFTNNPTITVAFTNNHSSIGFTLRFVEDYPLEMRIKWYKGADIIDTKVYTINSLEFKAYNSVSDYNKVVFEFIKARPNRYVKVEYIRYGIITEFNDTNCSDAKIVEQTDIKGNNIPISTLSIDLFSADKDFAINSQNSLQNYFQKKQPAECYAIVDGVETFLGHFYFDKLNSKGLYSTSLNMNDIIGIFEQFTFAGGLYNNYSASTLIGQIMAIIGISNYTIDASLASATISGCIKPCNCREALKKILTAIEAIAVTMFTDGIKFIPKIQPVIKNRILRENKFSTTITKNVHVSGVKVKYSNWKKSTEAQNVVDDVYDAGTYEIEFSNPSDDLSASGATIIESTLFGCKFTVDADNTQVVISCKEYTENNLSCQVVNAGDTNVNIIEIDAPLANNKQAMNIARNMLNWYNRHTLSIKAKYLTDFIEGLSENIILEDAYLEYNGYIGNINQMSINLHGGCIVDADIFADYYDNRIGYAYCDSELYAGEEVLL